MFKRQYFNLRKLNGTRFYLRPDAIKSIKSSLDTFLDSETSLNSLAFAKRVMFDSEIRANNQVEGYGDDIEVIKRAIENSQSISDVEKRARIQNLYHAYHYILNHGDINKSSLRELYGIISKDVLDSYDVANMGEFYRTRPVYILKNGRLDGSIDTGLPVERIEEFLNMYFEFLNTNLTGTETDEYIKSQILHFYFVYIHPYFDVNGRTSRTLAMWYLLNKKAYAYIIFNRGISFKGSSYDSTIVHSKETNDLTYFIRMMLETVELELEKEYFMQQAADAASYKLTAKDYQTLLYLLSMKAEKNIFTFAEMYNRNTSSDRKRVEEIYEEMIVPLLDKGVLDLGRKMKSEHKRMENRALILRPLDVDKSKVKNLQI